MAAPLRIATSSTTCQNLTLLLARTSSLQMVRGKKFKPVMTNPNFGCFAGDGSFVLKGDCIVKQKNMTDYPGENVGITLRNTLYALCDGMVVVSGEKLSPYPDSPLYERVKNGVEIYRKFYSVYPVPVHAKFKLVSMT